MDNQILDKVNYGTVGTQMYRGDMSSQTHPLQNAKSGTNTNLAKNSFTQTKSPRGYNIMGMDTNIHLKYNNTDSTS